MQTHLQRVLIIGRSLLLDSVNAALQRQAGIELLSAPDPSGNNLPDADTLARLEPDVILYAGTPKPLVWQVWLDRLPDTSFIALDPISQEALVYRGEVRRVATLNDLARLILSPGRLPR